MSVIEFEKGVCAIHTGFEVSIDWVGVTNQLMNDLKTVLNVDACKRNFKSKLKRTFWRFGTNHRATGLLDSFLIQQKDWLFYKAIFLKLFY